MRPDLQPSIPADGLSHYRYIDALRGFAFLGVLTMHVGRQVKPFPFAGLTEPGQYGVQLFFLLSAITLCRSFDIRKDSEVGIVRNFYLRRIFRIAPLFWCAMIFYTALDGTSPNYWSPTGLGISQLLLTATFLHGLMPSSINSVVPGGWSIAVEMTFYLLLPLLIQKIKTPLAAVACGFACLTINVLLGAALKNVFQSNGIDLTRGYIVGFFYFWFPAQAAVFFIGMATFAGLNSPKVMGFFAQSRRPTILVMLSAILLMGSCAMPAMALLPLHVLFAIALTPLIFSLAVRPRAVWVNRLTCGLGKLSFSCYLAHFGAIRLAIFACEKFKIATASPTLAAGIVWCAALATTVAIARLTFHLIERPGITLGNRLIRSLEASRIPVEQTQSDIPIRQAA